MMHRSIIRQYWVCSSGLARTLTPLSKELEPVLLTQATSTA